MTAKIEQIVNSRVYIQEPLGLLHRFKAAHAPLSNARWLMGKFGAVISISQRVMNRFRNQFSMRDTVASQLVRHWY